MVKLFFNFVCGRSLVRFKASACHAEDHGFKSRRPRIYNMTHEKEIKQLTEKIIAELNPEKIILFGSHAWGTPGPDSDVDLFVVKESNVLRRSRQLEARRLLCDSDVPFDVLVYTPGEIKKRLDLGDFFIKNIITKGEILYAKT